MPVLDRYIIRHFIVNYAISLAVLIGLYVVLDLFFNFDEFTQDGEVALADALRAALGYYGNHLFLYFAQISGVITLFAMLMTLARLQRNNEFVAIVSSGVSLYRVALTVILTGAVLNGLWLVDQELIIPQLAPRLAQDHAATVTHKPHGVWFVKDTDGSLLSACQFDHSRQRLDQPVIMHRTEAGQDFEITTADSATWKPTGDKSGEWQLARGVRHRRVLNLDGVVEIRRDEVNALPSRLSPDELALRQATNWIQFLPSRQLARLISQELAPYEQVARALHNRFATPVVNILILIIGIPFFLSRSPASVVQSSGKCLAWCGGCFLLAFFSQHVTISSWPPVLMAWLPLIILTPVMVVTFDRMKT